MTTRRAEQQVPFLFATASRPALGPTQPPIQRAAGILPPGQSDRSVKVTTHLYLMMRLRIHGAIPPLPHMSS